MKTEKEIKKHAQQCAHDHFYCDNGEVWQPFEDTPEDELHGMQEDLADAFERAMLWAVK